MHRLWFTKTFLPSRTCGALRPLRKSALLSDGAKFEPLSTPLQGSIRFFQHLIPALSSAAAALGILEDLCVARPRGQYRLAAYRYFYKQTGVGCLCIPANHESV